MSAYSTSKLIHHPSVIEPLRNLSKGSGGYTPPLHVQLIMSDLCNQDCNFCAYRMSGSPSNQLFGVDAGNGTTNNNPNRMIPYEKCVEILEDCAKLGTKAVQFTGGGEPLVHPNANMILNECIDRGMDLALVTNGVKMTDEVTDTLQHAQWVRISLDAGNSATYSEMRGVGLEVFHRVLNNIEGLVSKRRRWEHKFSTSSDLVIGVGFVITKDNWEEIVQCTELVRDLGVDNLRISAVFQPDGASYFSSWALEAEERCHEAEQLSTDDFKVFNNFTNRVEDLEQQAPEYSFCGIQNVQTYIGADLNLYRCCVLAYNERGVIGSLKEQSFYDLWTAKEFNGFDATKCPACLYNDKNRQILYMIEENPLHVNFI